MRNVATWVYTVPVPPSVTRIRLMYSSMRPSHALGSPDGGSLFYVRGGRIVSPVRDPRIVAQKPGAVLPVEDAKAIVIRSSVDRRVAVVVEQPPFPALVRVDVLEHQLTARHLDVEDRRGGRIRVHAQELVGIGVVPGVHGDDGAVDLPQIHGPTASAPASGNSTHTVRSAGPASIFRPCCPLVLISDETSCFFLIVT